MAIFSFWAGRKKEKNLVVKEKGDIMGEKTERINSPKTMFIAKNMEDISAYISVRIRDDKWIYINDGELEFIEYWKA